MWKYRPTFLMPQAFRPVARTWDRVHIVLLPPGLDLTPPPTRWVTYGSRVEPIPPWWMAYVNDALGLVAILLAILLLDVLLCGVTP